MHKLIYWPGIPGRGEFIRLAFEYAQVKYEDALDAGLCMKYLKGHNGFFANAPPILEAEDGSIITQTPNILLFLGPQLSLVGEKSQDIYQVNQLALTALDLNNEVHDTHHPVAVMQYYEDQKEEAKKKAADVRKTRIPKFLGYFENVINVNPAKSGLLVGAKVTYADLVLFQLVDGLQYSFPKCMKRLEEGGKIQKVLALKKKIETESPIKDYLASKRRQPYGDGIFRYYPELDE